MSIYLKLCLCMNEHELKLEMNIIKLTFIFCTVKHYTEVKYIRKDKSKMWEEYR